MKFGHHCSELLFTPDPTSSTFLTAKLMPIFKRLSRLR